ncbi:conserved hypothetical protein [Burkholderiales bacterium 8X]|nr:conserved hypothetical protein [Burkholderiales bacterium 8X]
MAVAGGANIDAVKILSLAGHIRAHIPRPVRTLTGFSQPDATVLELTPLGRSMLKRFPSV